MTDLAKPPIACSLTTEEFSDRAATILALFKSATIETEELKEGFAFRLPGDSKSIELAAKVIAAERECCRFLTFEMTAFPDMGAVIVRVTAPGGAKEFLKALLCKAVGR
jgi:hypothetical protein